MTKLGYPYLYRWLSGGWKKRKSHGTAMLDWFWRKWPRFKIPAYSSAPSAQNVIRKHIESLLGPPVRCSPAKIFKNSMMLLFFLSLSLKHFHSEVGRNLALFFNKLGGSFNVRNTATDKDKTSGYYTRRDVFYATNFIPHSLQRFNSRTTGDGLVGLIC